MPITSTNTKILFAICAVLWVLIVVRAYTNVRGTDALVATVPQSEVQALALSQLNDLQDESFERDLELCGIIYETSDGKLGVSRPRTGDQGSCDLVYFDEPGMAPVASFHTHGRHSDRYDGEVPSLVDLQGNVASGIDGYISPPGGRFWHIDHKARLARLVCGAGCMIPDPRYAPCPGDDIPPTYTARELDQRFTGPLINC